MLNGFNKANDGSVAWQDDERLKAIDQQLEQIGSQRRSNAESRLAANARKRQADALVDDLLVKVILGEASDKDVSAAKRARADAAQEEEARAKADSELETRKRALVVAREAAERSARMAARSRGLAAYKAVSEELAPILVKASALSHELQRLLEESPINLPGLPGSWPELRRFGHDDQLERWLREVKSFDWNQA